jgi:hypothetical protein
MVRETHQTSNQRQRLGSRGLKTRNRVLMSAKENNLQSLSSVHTTLLIRKESHNKTQFSTPEAYH